MAAQRIYTTSNAAMMWTRSSRRQDRVPHGPATCTCPRQEYRRLIYSIAMAGGVCSASTVCTYEIFEH